MASIRDIIGGIGRALGLGSPKPPSIPTRAQDGPQGHRGTARGDLSKPIRTFGETYHVPEEVQIVPADQVSRFLYEGAVFPVFSTNVEMAQYDHEKNVLIITFKGGSQYAYSNVSLQEAIGFAQAGSKGGWVWSNLRIRGTSLGHRKPYKKVR